jgi:hypothetical protein
MLAKVYLILAGQAPSPFDGLYKFDSFDLAILIPYLIVLLILSLYGIHRCWLIYTYLKCRHNVPSKESDSFEWPAVTIQVPIYYVFIFMIQDKNYRTAPFMLLFIGGFLYIGVMSAAQRWWEPLRQGAADVSSSEEYSAAVAPVLLSLPRGSETLSFTDSSPSVEDGESVRIRRIWSSVRPVKIRSGPVVWGQIY